MRSPNTTRIAATQAADWLYDDKTIDHVTDRRCFSNKTSQSRNVEDGPVLSLLPDSCHHCREPFKPRQIRYPIMDGVFLGMAGASSRFVRNVGPASGGTTSIQN